MTTWRINLKHLLMKIESAYLLLKREKKLCFPRLKQEYLNGKSEAMKMLSAHSKNQSKFIGNNYLTNAIDL